MRSSGRPRHPVDAATQNWAMFAFSTDASAQTGLPTSFELLFELGDRCKGGFVERLNSYDQELKTLQATRDQLVPRPITLPDDIPSLYRRDPALVSPDTKRFRF